MKLTIPSPAKLNLMLHVTGRREDGYHFLETTFCYINLMDWIHIETNNSPEIQFHTPINNVDNNDNLILKAAKLLQSTIKTPQGAHIWLKKNIPLGAGLGGGSSNAASTLIALNHLWQAKKNKEELQQMGCSLGADVPFFIYGHNAFASGIGDILEKINLPELFFLIAKPTSCISTEQIFKQLDLTQNSSQRIIHSLDGKLSFKNDLQDVVFKLYPEVREIHQLLSQYGKAVLTGSGSCVFVALKNKDEALRIKKELPKNLTIFLCESLHENPVYQTLK